MYNNPKYKYQFYAPESETQQTDLPVPSDPLFPPVAEEETNNNNNNKKPKKKNLITALKKLLAAFGGEETQSNNAVEIVDKIADSVEQGGGSGGGVLVVTFSGNTANEDAACDKTWAEIQGAYASGAEFIVKYDDDGLIYTLNAAAFIEDNSLQSLQGYLVMGQTGSGDLVGLGNYFCGITSFGTIVEIKTKTF